MAHEKNKPIHDEQPLAKLLEAAYVMQEHNRERQKRELNLEFNREFQQAESKKSEIKKSEGTLKKSKTPIAMSSNEPGAVEAEMAAAEPNLQTLAPIVETQHQIQSRHLDLENAMELVAERTTAITKAEGAAILLIAQPGTQPAQEEGQNAVCRAASGAHTPALGSQVAIHKALSCSSLRTGEVGRYGDVAADILLDSEECKRRSIASLITVPIYHEGKTAGALEVYFSQPNAFTEPQVHASQLMAGLVGEVLARNAQASLKKSLAAERASVLDALEKLQPNLSALVETSAAKDPLSDPPASISTSPAPSDASRAQGCRKCGHQMMEEEQFCGKCGSPRSGDYEPPSMQSKVATLWLMQQVHQDNAPAPANGAGIARAAAAPQGAAPLEAAKGEFLRAQISRPESEKSAPARKDPSRIDANRKDPNKKDFPDQLSSSDSDGDHLGENFSLQNLTLEDLGLPEMRMFDGHGGFHAPSSAATEEVPRSGDESKSASLQKNILHKDDAAFEDSLDEEEEDTSSAGATIPHPLDQLRHELKKLDAHKLDPRNLSPHVFASKPIHASAIDASTVDPDPMDASSPGPHREDSVLGKANLVEENNENKNAEEIPQAESGLSSDTRPTWTSAANAREFFEQLAGGKNRNSLVHFWNARRGDVYLALAVVLVAGVIRWGIWSNHSVSATGRTPSTANNAAVNSQTDNARPEPDADANLSAFERMLISLGLAEAPAAPENKGNPDTKVWIDTQSALYYCPADDLYGKTPKGKYTSQRDAQLDQYEPALHKTCD